MSRIIQASLAVLALATVSAGALGQAAPPRRTISITYQDLTGTQPPSSSAWVSHADGVHLWALGQKADFALKRLAEEGNPELIVADAMFDPKRRFADQAIGLIALPGAQRTLTLQVDAEHPLVSGVWMLGMTNDAFAGIDAVDAYRLTEPVTIEVYALDAGTRKNSERQPYTVALGGTDDDPEDGVIARHSGIRGDADIPASFKFDPSRPVARVTITPALER